MGCAIALKAFLTLPADRGALGGVFISGGIFCAEIDWKSIDLTLKRKTDICIYHGEEDTVVNISHAFKMYSRLTEKQIDFDWKPENGLTH